MDEKLQAAVIATSVGKTPEVITFSFVFDEIHKLVQRDVKVHVVRAAVEGDSISYGIHFHGIERRVDIGALTMFLKNASTYLSISLLRNPLGLYGENLYSFNVVKIVEKYNVNLIHSHFAYPEGLVGTIAKRATGKPLVVTLHGYDILTEPSVKYGIRLSKRYDVLVRRVLREADAVIVASRAVYEEASKICGCEEKMYLTPNGVDTKRFNLNLDGLYIRKKLNIEDKYVVFTVRHCRPVYGIEYLIRAASLVLKERGDVVFVIGGDGPLRPHYEGLSLQLGVADKIIFTGRISRQEVPYYYAMSDVVVAPSLQEAWGLVVTEAMASGKPVVGTRVGGIVDQIIDGYNGFLVPSRDPKAIAEKILWFLNNPDEARRMGINGRRLVEEKFDIEKRIDRIINVYKKLIG